MATLGAALRAIRQHAGLRQTEVAKILDIAAPQVSLREAEKRRTPAEDLQQLCAALGVSLICSPAGWDVVEIPDTLVPVPEGTADRVPPMMGEASAGTGANNDHIQPADIDIGGWLRGLDGLAMIKGDSMEPDYVEGDIVGVRRTSHFAVGQVVVARLISGDEVVKVYEGESHGKVELSSLNRQYRLIREPPSRIHVLGVVDGLIRLHVVRYGR